VFDKQYLITKISITSQVF